MPKGLQGFQKGNKLGYLNRGKVSSNKGKVMSEGQKEKTRQTWREKRRKRRSERMKLFWKEHPDSRKKISKTLKGHIPWNKGKKGLQKSKWKDKTIPHLGKYQFRKGKKHWNWKGGKVSRKLHSGERYRNWRVSIFQRDNWTCLLCNQVGGNLNVHHIKNWINYPELRFNVNNGITLCEKCHKLVHKIYGRSKMN